MTTLTETLKQEFEHEVQNTRMLLKSIPEKDLQFKPAPPSWTMGELAQHIATIYYWYVGVLTQDVYDIAADQLERGSPDDLSATLDLFERNVGLARRALNAVTDTQLETSWTMKAGDRVVLGPLSRGTVSRGFLFNHLYHHRGEMIVYLRATGNSVPGLYGPTAEES